MAGSRRRRSLGAFWSLPSISRGGSSGRFAAPQDEAEGSNAMTDLESFAFGDSPELADKLLALVLAGRKTATCWSASEGDKGVQVGKRWIVKDGRDKPRAILETVEVTRRRFGDVDAAFAHDEGEGDRTLADWRRMHIAYFTRRGEFAPDMEVFCERFRLVEALPD
jgi:uncharacterized protein YhfF